MSVTWTLWMWSIKNDEWDFVTEALEEHKRRVLSKCKMRNPRTARFKWTTGYKPKRFRQRKAEKRGTTLIVGTQGSYVCPYGCGHKSREPLRGHAAVCSMNPEARRVKK